MEGETALPTSDEIIASAAKFLIEGGEDDAASVLLACSSATVESEYYSSYGAGAGHGLSIRIRAPRAAYSILVDEEHATRIAIFEAIKATLPHHTWLNRLDVRADAMALSPSWRDELIQMARGTTVTNQAALAEKFQLWENLRFQSVTETRIAQALDRAGVMFFPLCRARLNSPGGRVNREPDFLVCHEGRWGILEVDGAPFHPSTRTTQDHERDRLFLNHGIRLVQHFDAEDCFVTPDGVVQRFLRLLERAYP